MSKPSKKEVQSLLDVVSGQQALLTQYLNNLTSDNIKSSTQLPPNPPNPLHVLRDGAKLLKAHTTKLALLLLNKPFTPSAIQKVVKDISGTCLPAIMTAVEICQPEVWGVFLKQHVIATVRTVMREMQVFYDEVKTITAKELDSNSNQEAGRDSLVSTALVWEACDRLIDLQSSGIGGLAVKRAEEWRDTIKDAIEELNEWEQEQDDDDDDDDDDDGDDDEDEDQDIFSAANSLPKDRLDIKQRLTTANDKLKKIVMLYAALIKRRLTSFTPSASSIQSNILTLDSLLAALKDLPDTVDDLASAFYDLDAAAVDEAMTDCINLATKAASLVTLTWDGTEDQFTAWVNKWLEVMKTIPSPT